MQLQHRCVGLAQTFEQDFQQAHGYFGIRLQILHKVVAVQFAGDGVLDSDDSGAAWLFINHAHFAKRLACSDIGQMNVLPVQIL